MQAANENPAQTDAAGDYAAALRAAMEPRAVPVRGRAAEKADAAQAIDI
ncbi:MAG: hypothetical protein IT535_08390, partial [Bauldia sp.]|nr:hypothetical protein [Bauldia sp.]